MAEPGARNGEDMRKEINDKAQAIAGFLNDHKGINTVVIDISEECSWADCFIITTVNSLGHLRGLAHELWGFLAQLGLEVTNRHKSPGNDGWELIDCSDIVIHLMSSELRDFYSLEKLWTVLN